MVKFKLEIQMGNGNVENKTDIVEILTDAVEKLKQGKDYGPLCDRKNEKVGRFYFTA